MKTNNEMIADIMTEIDNTKNKRKINGKTTAILISTMCLVLCIGIGAFAAKYVYPMFSDEWNEEIKTNIALATGKEVAEEFRERMKTIDDIYSEKAVKTGHDEVIMCYENSIPVNQIQQSGNLILNFKSITEAEVLRLVGSVVQGTEFEWQIQKRYYALFEITKADGQKFTTEDYIPFRFLRFVEGYDPYTTNFCLEVDSTQITVDTDNVMYYAVDITNMLIFADYDLFLTAIDMDGGFNILENIFATKEGDMILKDNAPENSVMFRFNLDSSFADKKAVKQFVRTYEIDSDRHFDNYTK